MHRQLSAAKRLRFVYVPMDGAVLFVPSQSISAKDSHVIMAAHVNRERDGFDAHVHKDSVDRIVG